MARATVLALVSPEAELRRMDVMDQELGRRLDAVGGQRKRLRGDIGQVRADYLMNALFPFLREIETVTFAGRTGLNGFPYVTGISPSRR